jgi:hypothetical protein
MIWVEKVAHLVAIYHDHENPVRQSDVYPASGLAGLGCRDRLGDHAHGAAPAPLAELDLPADQGEQGVIPATTDTEPGVEVRSVLADDDLARAHELATEPLDPESLGVGVAPVPAG